MFLRVAIGISEALGRVHARSLIHKDVKPDHVFVDPATGAAWFTGFGIASRLARERQVPELPETIAGTLAYMAPEQTGRMNRSVDARSDLYALGVTLYQMLTGELPFTATDPMELVHCHIARQPVPPAERAPGVSPAASAVVMKLLAKTAEDRYQTAAGVCADLRRCLEAHEAGGPIEVFPLGGHDIPDVLRIPEKLYGREVEVGALVGAFERVVAHGTPELILVSGYSGVGKSSVVNELHKALSLSHGIFAAGKCDQYKRDIPYATLARALQSLVTMILGSSEAELARWRDSIRQAVEPNGRLVASLIPELELVIGKQAPVPDLPPQDSRNRFQMVFRGFLQVFARPEHPLVLFLDDLQWIDAATLALIEDLIGRSETRHLLLIGAYRDNEVGPTHPLVPALDALRRAGTRVHEMVLSPLSMGDLGRLIAGTLHCDEERVRPLARLVWEKTGGNPFFASQFLTELADQALVSFDPALGAWTWDVARIGAKSYTDNIVELMVAKLKRLPDNAQESLQELACLGNIADFPTLAIVRDGPEEAIHSAFEDAAQAGLVFPLEGAYAFAHDRVQEAAYALIPRALRPQMHLRIGRRLGAGRPAELSEQVFAVVNQLNHAVELIADPDERMQLLRLNVQAGLKAKAAIAYRSARDYLAQAQSLVAPDAWTSCYDETLELHLALAECEYLVGNFASADQLFDLMLCNASSDLDRARIYSLRMKVCQVGSKYEESFALAVEALRLFGVTFPESNDEIRAAADAEFRAIPVNLGQRRISDLLDAPAASSGEVRAIINLLVDAMPGAYIGRPQLFPLVAMKAVNFSLRYGNTDLSSYAYAVHALVLVSVYAEMAQAFEYSEMALRLNEKFGNVRLRGTLLHLHGDHINFWRRHFATGVPILEQAFRACLEVGDLVYAGYLAFETVWQAIERGDTLEEARAAAAKNAAFARQSHIDAVYETIQLEQQFVASLQGSTSDPLKFDEGGFDEAASLGAIASAAFGCGIVFHHIMKQMLAFLHGRHAEALEAARRAESTLGAAMAMPIEATHHFYHALTLTALYPGAPPAEQAEFARLLEGKLQKLRLWSDNCPENYRNRYALVLAEVARIEGRSAEAMDLYEEASRSARQNGFVQNEAIANELAAQFYAARGFETIAHAYLRNARYCYLRWGADGKVRQLDQLHPQLRAEPAPPVLTATAAARAEGLDLASVVKMSQAVSGEIVLEKLIDKLMSIALEHAGAQRGLLILPDGEAQRVQAEAAIGEEKVELGMRDAAVTPADMPESILRYVIRTHESVLLDDASQPNPYSSDPYIARGRSRSILCLPLLEQASLIGVLYLENPLAARVFTPARIAVLNLLASQAAISLENARLYADLQKENAERRQSEEALRRSEERYALAVRAAGDGHTEWIVATDELFASPRLLEMLGLPPDTRFAGRADFLARFNFHSEDRERALRTLDEYYAGDSTRLDYEVRILRGNETRWLHITVLCSRDAAGAVQRSNSAITDITERKLAEEALRQSEERFALAVAGANEGIFDWDLPSDRVYVSQRAQELFGMPAGELWRPRRQWREILNFHPEDARLQHDSIKALIAGETPTYDMEFRIILADGSHRWFRQRGIALRDAAGRAYRLVGSIGDITDRKRAQEELLRVERRLRQAQRLEAMGTLAGGIAHDFNNILGAVLGFGERALRAAPADGPLAGYVDRILSAGERGRALVDRILAFSSNTAGECVAVHAEKVVAEALDLLAGRLPAGIRVKADLRAGRAAILGDPTQVHRVLMNLATNAIQAMPSGGVLRVALDVLRVAGARLAAVGGLEPGEYVVLTVADEGTGMPAEVLEHIFDPFFTTKEAGIGTGLGLSLVHGIVANMEGAIDVTTRQQEGSVFTVYLPRSGQAEVAAGGEAPALPRGARQRVLLVDDEKALVGLAAEILEDLGYQPLGFTSSSAALEAFRADPKRFDAVITDERMPGMTGSALIKALRAIRRDLPILLMSGFVGGGVASRAREAGADDVLKKPLSERDLATSLARVLPT